MLKQLLSLVIAAPLAAAGAQAPAAQASAAAPDSLRFISLQEAVTLAQRNAPSAVQARGQLRTAASSVRSAWGSYIPSLTMSMGQSKRSSERFDQNLDRFVSSAAPWSYSTGLSTGLELFDGGRRRAELRASRAEVDAAETNQTAQQFTIALDVKREYANILAARESEASAKAQLEQAAAQLRASVAKVRAGAATMSDSLRSVIQVGNARLAMLTAQNNVRVASASLTRLVGTQFLVTANPADTADFALVSADSGSLMEMAVAGPAVQQAETGVRVANAGVRSSRSAYLPTLRASYNYGGSGTDPYALSSQGNFRYSTNLRFDVNFPLFNNFGREDAVVRARVAQDNAEAQLRDARLAAQQSIIQQIGALRTAEERIKIQQASVVAAEEDLRVMQQRYALGASTLLDLLTSQSLLNQARAALIQARQDYRISRAQIEAIIGRDLQ